jgi:hypothetical protein
MTDTLLAPTFLFRFAVPCQYRKTLWSKRNLRFGPQYDVPSFAELEGRQKFAQFRAAWNEGGLVFDVRVNGKKQSLWCRQSRPDDSDGLQVWIDTRNAHNIHRATRFCHHFVFLPRGAGRGLEQPVAALVPINRARANPNTIGDDVLKVRSEMLADGYRLHALVPAEALTGFDPSQQPRLGFSYAMVDRELGWQTLSVGPEFPISEDPSLWGTLDLCKP